MNRDRALTDRRPYDLLLPKPARRGGRQVDAGDVAGWITATVQASPGMDDRLLANRIGVQTRHVHQARKKT